MRHSVRDVFESALDLLRQEQYKFYFQMQAQLRGCPIQFSVDHERFGFAVTSHQLDIVDECFAPLVRVETSRRVICHLLDDELSLIDAAKQDRLKLQGGVESLVCLDNALGSFLRGIYKCSRAPELVRELRL